MVIQAKNFNDNSSFSGVDHLKIKTSLVNDLLKLFQAQCIRHSCNELRVSEASSQPIKKF